MSAVRSGTQSPVRNSSSHQSSAAQIEAAAGASGWCHPTRYHRCPLDAAEAPPWYGRSSAWGCGGRSCPSVHSAQGVKLQNPDARGHERRQSISMQLLPSKANRAPTNAAHPPRADRHAVQSCTPYMKVHECASLILKKNIHPARNAGWLPDVCISLTGVGSCWPHHLFPARSLWW